MRYSPLCLALASLLPMVTRAQAAAMLCVGAHVRISAASQQLQDSPARLTAVRGDTLVLSVDGDEQPARTLVLDDIQHLDVEQGRSRWKGIAAGYVLGAVVGGAIGYFTSTSSNQSGTQGKGPEIISPTDQAWMTGAGIGGLSGIVLGWFMAPARWVDVPLPGKSK